MKISPIEYAVILEALEIYLMQIENSICPDYKKTNPDGYKFSVSEKPRINKLIRKIKAIK